MERIIGEFWAGRTGFGLLVLRVVMGVALMVHGQSKIMNPMHWMDKPNKPSPIPDWMQAFAACAEFIGGAAIAAGLLTPFACLAVMGTMVGAYLISHRQHPWIAPGKPNFELASLYFTMAASLIFTGPGIYSLDYLVFRRERRLSTARLARMGGRRDQES